MATGYQYGYTTLGTRRDISGHDQKGQQRMKRLWHPPRVQYHWRLKFIIIIIQ